MCFTPSGICLIKSIFQFQGITNVRIAHESDINILTKIIINQGLSSGFKSLIVDVGKVTHSVRYLHQEENTDKKLGRVISVPWRTIDILIQLLTLLHINVFITGVIIDNFVHVSTTVTAASQSNVPLNKKSMTATVLYVSGTVLHNILGILYYKLKW